MRPPICTGDKLENGGEVTGGSPYTQFMGRKIARRGDPAQCDEHGTTCIAEGDTKFPDRDGKPFTMHMQHCECGCAILSSLANIQFG